MAINKKTANILYGVGLTYVFIGVGLLLFSLYLIPHVLFDLSYDVPEFFIRLTFYFEHHHDLDGYALLSAIFLPFIVGALLFFYFAKRITRRLDEETTALESSTTTATSTEIILLEEEMKKLDENIKDLEAGDFSDINIFLPKTKADKKEIAKVFLPAILLIVAILFVEFVIVLELAIE